MDVKPPMVISLAKKEELVYVQAKAQPVKLPRNHAGLRLLQYIRDEAHRFAQHYHHILRRKSQIDEQIAQGRRPPRKKKAKPASPATSDQALTTPQEMPLSTHATLPVLQPRHEPEQQSKPIDAEDLA
jgi:hypothetical protein